jgi:oxygen-independent coproporphyrinogen-3 oxidase
LCISMPSLYIHVPFCIQKCDYCAFYSHSLGHFSQELIIPLYLEGLKIEMERRKKDAPQGVSSLFIGGGTPTVLENRDLECLMKMIDRYFCLNSTAEKTIEGNPGSITAAKLTLIRRYGINRFSLGVQSFNDNLLKAVGRMHTAQEAREAIGCLRTAGFENINMDLMFGLPEQNMAIWQATIEEALSYAPEHLSLYGLILEEGTPLFERFKANNALLDRLPDDDLQAEMYDWSVERLKQAGYRHYETSNFARPGYECRHNLGYWQGKDYLGLGPGAVSCLNRVRWKNIAEVRIYQSRLHNGQDPVDAAGREVLSLHECMAERVILGLRLEEGVNLTLFKSDFGVDLRDIYRDVLERYKNKNVFIFSGEYMCLNPKYSFIANLILQDFV